MAYQLSAESRRRLDTPFDMLIGGSWSGSTTGATRDIVNPATGIAVARAAIGSAADVDRAVAAARNSFDEQLWRALGADARARILWRISELIEQNAVELAQLEVLSSGLLHMHAQWAVGAAAEAFRYHAGWANKIHGRTTDLSQGSQAALSYTLREPIGVAGLIIPWNGPLVLASWKLAPALAAGCSCILKPAEETPLTAVRLGELMMEAGVPPGVVNILPGGREVGEALTNHADIDKISFTGSTAVGKAIIAASAGNLKRLTLELGGKSPFIIFDDARMDVAIPNAAAAIFSGSGQVCVAGSRLYIQRRSYEHVLEGVAAAARALKLGDGFDPEAQMGPLISSRQLSRVRAYVALGKTEGAEVIAGGETHGDAGFFFQPTVFAGAKQGMRIAREEIFGPVLVAIPFDTLDEVVALANDTQYGLAAYLWSESASTIQEVTARLRAGTVCANTPLISSYSVPFGGYKQSGWGRENGPDGIEAFLETKTVTIGR